MSTYPHENKLASLINKKRDFDKSLKFIYNAIIALYPTYLEKFNKDERNNSITIDSINDEFEIVYYRKFKNICNLHIKVRPKDDSYCTYCLLDYVVKTKQDYFNELLTIEYSLGSIEKILEFLEIFTDYITININKMEWNTDYIEALSKI